MTKKDYTCGFPAAMPVLIIKESSRPFAEIKCADEGVYYSENRQQKF